MIKNVPYFRKVEDYIIHELVNYLKPKRYEAGTLIVQRGDMIDEIYLLKSGSIIVEVPVDEKSIYLDWLNEGGCFCIYAAFNDQQYQMVSFRASSTCIVETISIKDLFLLQKSHIQLSDIFKQVEIDILNGEKTNLDYFRYIPPRNAEISDDFYNIIKSRTRSKFRSAVIKFTKEIKSGERKPMVALEALRKF